MLKTHTLFFAIRHWVMGLTLISGLTGISNGGWIAYNDSAFKPGQTNAPNTTTYGLGRSFAGEGQGGPLKDFSTGEPTGVTVEYTEIFTTGSVNSAGDAAPFIPDTDAAALFAERADLSGNMSYGDAPGWAVELTISGLNPSRRYSFAGTADRRGGAGYADRVTNWSVLGADALTYASSPGAHRVSDRSVEFSTGENSAGLLARWTNIRPGADGTIVIRTSHSVGVAAGGLPGAHAFRGYGGGLFLVSEQVDQWEAYNDSAFKSGQTNDPNATTFGLGRSFAGEGNSGSLKILATGENSLVTAAYTEFITAGSVNSAGDAADYPAGSDAEAEFKGRVNLAGNMSYGDAPGWYVDLELTGLDPTKRYSFAATADRKGGAGYAERVTNWSILSAASAQNASSVGTHKVSETSVEFSTGDNAAGLVARWTEIDPGSDGRIIIRTTHSVGQAQGGLPGAHAFRGYAGGVFSLKAGPYRWRAFNDSSFKPGQINEPTVTTYGLGRSFAGEAGSGPLKNSVGGAPLSVEAAYTETISSGSVNSAGDAADFPAGSDAEAEFKGMVDLAGNMSYGDAPGWSVDLTLTGLDPSRRYTFAGTADRKGGAGYAERVTNWSIIEAEASRYASTPGTHKVSETSVEFSTGDNATGLVARWTDIAPGADGTIIIRTSHSVGQANGGLPGAHAFRGYAGGVFLVAEQYTTSAGVTSRPIDITDLLPAENSMEASPSSPLRAVLRAGDQSVKEGSVTLKLDGMAVTPIIVTEAGTTTVLYQAPAPLPSASTHTVELSFLDNSPTPRPYTKQWSFTVLAWSEFPVLGKSLSLPFDPTRYQRRGMALNLILPDSAEGYPFSTLDDAQAILNEPFTNLVDPALLNSLGYFEETTALNYQIDGTPVGNIANESLFPSIAGRGEPFALEAFTLLHLKPGHHRFNITMQPAFRLYAGGSPTELEIPATFSPCTNCGGDDAPWIIDLMVTDEGLYPFRLFYFGAAGSASLEWVNLLPDGTRHLINGTEAGAIPAYFPLDTIGGSAAPSIALDGDTIVIGWTGPAMLQSSLDLASGRWQNIAPLTNPYRIPAQGSRFFRLAR